MRKEVNRTALLAIAAIALTALAVRLAPSVASTGVGWAMEPNGDSAAYIGLADGLRRGCGFALWTGARCDSAETNRTPGYPAFLAAMPGLRAALFVQAAMWSLVCYLVGYFTASLAGARAGYCAATIVALDVPSITAANQIMSETLFTALLVAAALAELEILRGGKPPAKLSGMLALVSAMLGFALIVRPIAEFLIPLFVLAPMLIRGSSRRARALMALLVAAGPVLCGASWALRNSSVAGVAAISTIGRLNFFYYRAVGSLAFASGSGWSETVARTMPLPNADLSAQAWRIVAHHPFAFMAMTLWSFIYLCWVPVRAPLAQLLGVPLGPCVMDPGSVRIESLIHQLWTGNLFELTAVVQEFRSSRALLSLTIFQLIMSGFVWAGVALVLKRYTWPGSPLRRAVLFAFALALLTLLAASGPEAVARFRVPAVPLLAFLAGVGLFGNPLAGY